LAKSEDIAWKRLTAEAIAIVVSILLAFWIDAWWEQRLETKSAIEHLQAFEVELVDNGERLDASIREVNSGLRNLIAAMTKLADPEIEHLPESIQSDIGAALWFQGNANVMSAYYELVNSNSYSSLQNSDLIKSIGDYGLLIESLGRMNDYQGESYLAVVLPALSQHLALSNLGWTKYDDAFDQSDENSHNDLQTQFLANDNELRSREFLNALYHWKTVQIDIRDALTMLQEDVAILRPLLHAEIEDLTR